MDLAVTKCGELKVKAMKHCQICVGKKYCSTINGSGLEFCIHHFCKLECLLNSSTESAL